MSDRSAPRWPRAYAVVGLLFVAEIALLYWFKVSFPS